MFSRVGASTLLIVSLLVVWPEAAFAQAPVPAPDTPEEQHPESKVKPTERWGPKNAYLKVKGGKLHCGFAGDVIDCSDDDDSPAEWGPVTVTVTGPQVGEVEPASGDSGDSPRQGGSSGTGGGAPGPGPRPRPAPAPPPPPPPPSGVEVATFIAQRMQISAPQVGVAPPARAWFVNIAGWVWIEQGWVGVRTDYEIRGTRATVVASPVEYQFWPGDGSPPVRCQGPGTKWFDGQANDASGRCTHTFYKNTPEQTKLPSAVTIIYRLDWNSPSDGTSGSFGIRPGPLVRVPINVDQIVSTGEPTHPRRP